VISRVAVWVSTIAALVLVASFGMFAIDQARDGSKQQVAKLGAEIEPSDAKANVNQAAPSARTEREREKLHSGPREAIDDVDDVLVAPFSSVTQDADSIWVQRGIPTLIALLLFGVGLRLIAAYLPGGTRR
jgi:hypothetical protein